MVELIHGAWQLLPRQEKQAIVLLFLSIPLSVFSIVIGLRDSDYLLVTLAAVCLLCGGTAVAFVGFALLSLLYVLLKLVLSLPLRALKWTAGFVIRRSATPERADRGEEVKGEGEGASGLAGKPQEEKTGGFDLIEWGLLGWLGAAVWQFVLVIQKLT